MTDKPPPAHPRLAPNSTSGRHRCTNDSNWQHPQLGTCSEQYRRHHEPAYGRADNGYYVSLLTRDLLLMSWQSTGLGRR